MQMADEEIKQIIFRLLKKIAPDTEPASLEPGDDIRRKLEIDSFDALQFLVALDEHFGIETPEEDYGKTRTLEGLLNYIRDKIKSKPAA